MKLPNTPFRLDMTKEEVVAKVKEDATLWVWKSKRGYWDGNDWTKDKTQAKKYQLYHARLTNTLGKGTWQPYENLRRNP